MSYTIDSARTIFPDTQVADAVPAIIKSFNQLSAEDQLALLWFAYTEMGVSITPAAMSAINMVFAEKTLTQIKQMPPAEQTQVMCDLVNHTDTPICRTHSSFGTNIKLGFWYQLSEWMKQEKDVTFCIVIRQIIQNIRCSNACLNMISNSRMSC